jgi:hypothetical protein
MNCMHLPGEQVAAWEYCWLRCSSDAEGGEGGARGLEGEGVGIWQRAADAAAGIWKGKGRGCWEERRGGRMETGGGGVREIFCNLQRVLDGGRRQQQQQQHDKNWKKEKTPSR